MSENKICQNCKNDFIIEPEDFNFYEKIKVPPPTFCPRCRSVRRMATANERVLYKRKCDLTGKDIFSMFRENAPFPVYETSKWYSDEWDPYQYAMDYDFTRPFFEQFKDLMNKVPRMSLVRQGFSTNSEYTNRVTDMKDSYMIFRATRSQDSMYSYNAIDIINCVDCFNVHSCELCYEAIDCHKCYRTLFSQECTECRDSMFLYACKNCSNCIGCVNLVNQEYCIWNIKYSKEEYEKKLKEMNLHTSFGLSKMEQEFDIFRKKFPQRSRMSLKSNKVSGNWFTNCQNVEQSFTCDDVKDGKYLYFVFAAQDCMDYFQWGNKSELIYESQNCGLNSSRLAFCTQCWTGAHDLYYCDSCPSSGNCFGCVGLKKGEYSILNKKYSKVEYEEMLPKIKQHMLDMPYIDKKSRVYKFGENFPIELSVFPYNETAAADFYPMTQEEIIESGYEYRELERKNYQATIKNTDLPDSIEKVQDSILNEVIECGDKDNSRSVGAFRVTQNEVSFYRKMDLPIPKYSFNIRHLNRFNKRPKLEIIKRNCDKCGVEVDTVYTEAYSPIIYCEECYKQEVY